MERTLGADSYSRRAADILRRQGALSLTRRFLGWLVSPIVEFGSIVFFVRDLEEDQPAGRGAAGIEPRFVSPSEVPRLLLRPDRQAPAVQSSMEESLRRGHLYAVAFAADGRPLHTRWVASEPALIPEIGREFVPGPEGAYLYGGYTREDARGRGIDGIMRRFIFERMRAQGCRRAYSYVRGDNPIGLKAAGKWQRRFATVRYVKLPGLGPIVFGCGDPSLAGLLRRPMDGGGRSLDRERAWREWFEGWLGQDLTRRSTGYHALPDAYFASASGYVVSTLRLDPVSDFVLDLGCDSAMITRRVAPRCRRLVGADFIAGQLADARRQGAACASGEPAEFLAADGRLLPFPSALFTKVYCTGVIHTLPSHQDAMKVIDELLRVCAGGGQVLLGALPAREKRGTAWRRLWRQAGPAERLRLAVSLVLPKPLKRAIRRLLAPRQRDGIVSLVFDLGDLKARLERRGLTCRISDFPPDYWSEDFRETRSNLLISIPENGRPTGPILT